MRSMCSSLVEAAKLAIFRRLGGVKKSQTGILASTFTPKKFTEILCVCFSFLQDLSFDLVSSKDMYIRSYLPARFTYFLLG